MVCRNMQGIPADLEAVARSLRDPAVDPTSTVQTVRRRPSAAVRLLLVSRVRSTKLCGLWAKNGRVYTRRP